LRARDIWSAPGEIRCLDASHGPWIIEQAFKDPNWEHAKAINALRLVPLEIDPMIADLVARFSAEIKKRGWKRVEGDDGRKYWLDQWSAHYNLVAADLAEARRMAAKASSINTSSTCTGCCIGRVISQPRKLFTVADEGRATNKSFCSLAILLEPFRKP